MVLDPVPTLNVRQWEVKWKAEKLHIIFNRVNHSLAELGQAVVQLVTFYESIK
jgi:hypothetical protein